MPECHIIFKVHQRSLIAVYKSESIRYFNEQSRQNCRIYKQNFNGIFTAQSYMSDNETFETFVLFQLEICISAAIEIIMCVKSIVLSGISVYLSYVPVILIFQVVSFYKCLWFLNLTNFL